MIDKPITAIIADDIRRLVDEGTPERRTLEFKRELPGNSDSDKKEFLADVSSFANGAGGDLVFGVEETAGRAIAADGLIIVDVDAAILRLEQMIRTGISPRIVGFQIHRVDGLTNGPTFVIRIPRSWQGPHVVSYQQSFRFWGRNAAGKFPMDVSDIRDAVLNAGSTEERIRTFRMDRNARIAAGETPVALAGSKLIVIHVVPFVAVGRPSQVDLRLAANTGLIPFASAGGGFPMFNIDGIYAHSQQTATQSLRYVQCFRNGSIESVEAEMLMPIGQHPLVLPTQLFVRELFSFVQRVMDKYATLSVDPPYALLVSLLGCKGVPLPADQFSIARGFARPLDRDALMVPEVILDSRNFRPEIALKPLLDSLWQAFGSPQCEYYDDSGQWRGSR